MNEKIAVQNLKSKRNRKTIIKKLKEHNIDKNAIIVCIGTPKVILDAVGPKVGQMLKNNEDILVYGTVDEPANAITIDRIRGELKLGKVIIFDLSAGTSRYSLATPETYLCEVPWKP